MKFKNPTCEIQFSEAPRKLKEIALYFEELSREFGIEPVITRVRDKIIGDSGVHEAWRGIDFRDETFDEFGKSTFLYDCDQEDEILEKVNAKFPREDGKETCICHSFEGGPMHFHCQSEYSSLTPEEIARIEGK